MTDSPLPPSSSSSSGRTPPGSPFSPPAPGLELYDLDAGDESLFGPSPGPPSRVPLRTPAAASKASTAGRARTTVPPHSQQGRENYESYHRLSSDMGHGAAGDNRGQAPSAADALHRSTADALAESWLLASGVFDVDDELLFTGRPTRRSEHEHHRTARTQLPEDDDLLDELDAPLPSPDELLLDDDDLLAESTTLRTRQQTFARSGHGYGHEHEHVHVAGETCTLCDWTHEMFMEVGAEDAARKKKLDKLAVQKRLLEQQLESAKGAQAVLGENAQTLRQQLGEARESEHARSLECAKLAAELQAKAIETEKLHEEVNTTRTQLGELNRALREGLRVWFDPLQAGDHASQLLQSMVQHDGEAEPLDSESVVALAALPREVAEQLLDDLGTGFVSMGATHSASSRPLDPAHVRQALGTLARRAHALAVRVNEIALLMGKRGVGPAREWRRVARAHAFASWRHATRNRWLRRHADKVERVSKAREALLRWQIQVLRSSLDKAHRDGSAAVEAASKAATIRVVVQRWRSFVALRAVQRELDEALGHVADAEARLAERDAQLAEAGRHIDALADERDELSQQLEELGQRHVELVEADAETHDRVRNLESSVDALETICNDSEQQLREASGKLLASLLRPPLQRALRAAFVRWRSTVRDMRAEDELRKQRGLVAWRLEASRRRAEDERRQQAHELDNVRQAQIQSIAYRQRCRTLRSVFNAWTRALARQQQLATIEALAAKRLGSIRASFLLTTWHSELEARRHRRRLSAAADEFWRKRLVARAWATWRHRERVVKQQARAAWRVARLVGRSSLLRMAFHCWRERTVEDRYLEAMEQQADVHDQTLQQVTHEAQLEQEALLKQAQMLVLVAERHMQRKRNVYVASQHFHLWRRLLQRKLQIKATVRSLIARRRRHVLTTAYRRWVVFMHLSRQHEQLALRQQLAHDTELQRQQVEMDTRTIQDALAHRYSVSCRRLAASLMLSRQHQFKRAVLHALRQNAVRHRVVRRLFGRSQAGHERNLKLAALRAWHGDMHRLRELDRHAEFWLEQRRTHRMQAALAMWRWQVRRRSLFRAVVRRYLAWARRRSLSGALLRWRSMVLCEQQEDLTAEVDRVNAACAEAEEQHAEERRELQHEIKLLRGDPHHECNQRIRGLLNRAQEDMVIKDEALARLEDAEREIEELRRALQHERDTARRVSRAHELLKAQKLSDIDVSSMFLSRLEDG